jgi:hypothetical protein
VYRRVIHLLSDGGQGIIELLKLQQISEAQLAWVFLLHSIAMSLSSTWFALQQCHPTQMPTRVITICM